MSILSAIYGGVVAARNHWYDRDAFRARTLTGPVISVGSISAGGAGKTPFVILLGELLKQRRVAFDVLSRGYGRRTRAVMLVDPNGAAKDFGDEPLLIARRLGCPVVVGENRHDAGQFAEKKFGPRLHILDDGFQHRSLARDFDIALLTPEDVRDTLIPAGRLRETLLSLRRADAVAIIGEIDTSILPISRIPTWRTRRDLAINGAPPNPIAFCGIARPRQFMEQLRAHGVHPVGQKTYRDHHPYSASDIDGLIRLKTQNNAGGFVTTEKDAVNLGPRIAQLQPIAIAQVTLEIAEPADALDTVLLAIANRQKRT